MKQVLRRFLRSSPVVHSLLRRYIERYRRLGLGPNTEVVIEGYPRCANSFATLAFMTAQPEPVNVAHHLHSLAQVKLGVKRGLPTLVLIREPCDAALSLTIRTERRSVVWALEEYLDFYRGVEPLLHNVTVADFAETTTDMGAVIRRMNLKFGTHYEEFRHTEENAAEIYRQLDSIEQAAAGGEEIRETHVARPSSARKELKQRLAAELETSPARELAAEATQLYRRILARSRDFDSPASSAATTR